MEADSNYSFQIRGREVFALVVLGGLCILAYLALTPGLRTLSKNKNAEAAIKAQLAAIGTGLEMFQNDENKYPYSNAAEYGDLTGDDPWVVNGPNAPLQGANLLVDAVIGRDVLGHDPKPSSRAGGSTQYVRWKENNPRRKPYIDPAGIGFASAENPVEDAFGKLDSKDATPKIGPTGNQHECPVFLDRFEKPILYYRASPSSNRDSPMFPQSLGTDGLPEGNPVYNWRDNIVFTNHQKRADERHELYIDPNWSYTDQPDKDLHNNRFVEFIMSFRNSDHGPGHTSTQPHWTRIRPVNPQGFILLSPGKDGIFGNLDDLGNFPVMQER